MNIQGLHELFLNCSSVSTDTRKIVPNSMFFAIKGERFDANTFAAEALEKGAAYVVIDNSEFYIDARTVLVGDSLEALQQLAKFHRQYLKLPVIGLTGSNGKTTTKELMLAVLGQKYKVKATIGNLNNHIGVPLTLLSFDQSTQLGIVEMGANHQKEIEFLCDLALPDYGYITNFGKAHLEGFGGIEGVIKGKSELYDHLRSHDKMAFVNQGDLLQVEKSDGIARFSFGLQCDECQLRIESVDAEPFVNVTYHGQKIQTQLIGAYNANNISAAIAVGKYFEVDDILIKKALENYAPDNNRSQLLKQGSNEVIMDAYNANPSSMAAALRNFAGLKRERKVAILGDMFELGVESAAEHAEIVEMLSDQSAKFIFVGHDFYKARNSRPGFLFFSEYDELRQFLIAQPITDSTILIKGSRGMALERILEIL